MPQLPITRMSLRLPPVRRLYDALRQVSAASQTMRTEQDRLARDLARMSGELASLRATLLLYRQVQERGHLDLSRDGALDAVIGDTSTTGRPCTAAHT